MLERERRAHDRLDLERPCKLYIPKTGKYRLGSTWNLSSGGALLQVETPVPLEPGDRVFVGVAMTRRQALFCSGDMHEAGVVRVMPTADDGIALAIHFTGESGDAVMSLRRAA